MKCLSENASIDFNLNGKKYKIFDNFLHFILIEFSELLRIKAIQIRVQKFCFPDCYY